MSLSAVTSGRNPFDQFARRFLTTSHCGRVTSVLLLVWGIFTGRNEVVAKVMFLQVCVCPRGGGCLPQCMLGCHTPPDGGTPPGPGRPPPGTRQTPPGTRQTPPGDQADPPGWRTPPGTRQTPPGPGRPPADSSIWSTSGRYASYWNAFLFTINTTK